MNAQQRFLVSSAGEVRPLPAGQNAKRVIDGILKHDHLLQAGACSPNLNVGYDDANYPANLSHTATHKNLFAEWFLAPYNGKIESVYVHMAQGQGDLSNDGGFLSLRIHKSNVFAGSGPGYGVYPTPPDTTCWGYYFNGGDVDNHVGAFLEDVSGVDTVWQSKYYLNSDHGAVPSYPPAGEEIWGNGGFQFSIMHAGQDTVIGVGTALLGEPTVTAGEPLFISLTIPGQHPPTVDSTGAGNDPTEVDIQAYEDWNPNTVASTPDSVQLVDHDWKFYEHVIGHCADPNGSHPLTEAGGWVARGLWNDKIWFVLDVTQNTPPTIQTVDIGRDLSYGKSTKVTSQIFDCDFALPSAAGVGNVYLLYWTDPAHVDSLFMVNSSADNYTVTLPAQTFQGWLNYAVEAYDGEGWRSVTPNQTIGVDFREALRIRDNAGKLDSLVFIEAPGATSGIDTSYGEYGIAEEPPAGTFDARWYLNDTAQSKIDAIPPALPDTLVFHVQPGGHSYPITISWDSVGLPPGTYLLEDGLTHGSLLSVNMQKHGSATIADSTTDSLEIVHMSQVLSAPIAKGDALPKDFSLRQNYPDPFNPTTRIEYSLPENATVRLAVYNILGQEVALLVNERETPGEKSIEWNGAAMPSGVYFYELEATGESSSKVFSQSRKMMLVK
jgi:hypothetical protein